ncbi:MAG: ATP-binding cassette domain-containing protein [Gammaproteobacteria bacterium]|nr:ATP-binding cassette domain-containing protein [Gammaproteobacteria bacterium]
MLVRLNNASLAFGHHPLLDKAELTLESAERVCLIGRNGTGKSTLMKVIAGEIQLDDGELWCKPGVRIARLQQDVPRDDTRKVFDVIVEGLGDLAQLVSDYQKITHQLETSSDEKLMEKLSRLQHELEARDGWTIQQRVDAVVSKLELPVNKSMNELSGGWIRRTLLGQALACQPDLLLLDEPTNHLDIEAIQWLEQFLVQQNIGLLFVTHDRTFLRRLATRIIELDRGHLTSWPGDYDNFLRRKEERLAAEENENQRFDKKLAQEEVWIRQGIKARRTRNEGRVRRLKALREERARRRDVQGSVFMGLDSGGSSGKIVFEVEDINYAWEGEPLIEHFSTRIMRGDRIGLIGPNGCGKSSLLKLLLKKTEPNSGEVTQGTNLTVAYFDQQRTLLDPKRTVIENVGDGKDFITVQGRSRHVISYLKDFLFDPERLNSPVSTLSGGESNRLMLAKLFTQPANVLVLDEPTNDLDMDTLDLLEDLLSEYEGTLIVVSHDRDFLDNIVTSTIVFHGHGRVQEYVGGWSDYERQSSAQKKPLRDDPPAVERTPTPARQTKSESKPAKLSYKEQRELDALPGLIESLEAEQLKLQQASTDPSFYQQNQQAVAAQLSRLEEISAELERAIERWGLLEERQSS